jgi:microcompartment protein CcmL/EutN
LVVLIDSDMLLLAMFAGTIAAVAWAMEKAAAIAEENSQFI